MLLMMRFSLCVHLLSFLLFVWRGEVLCWSSNAPCPPAICFLCAVDLVITRRPDAECKILPNFSVGSYSRGPSSNTG
ncbi:hypothetical protein JOL62DRAFT_238182 [Phyllosticta paracitricarpa]|uniref:Secreted protein n=1 Tax=Phyllosticta paracitricarpa TaxID=2016321 RepID=A0ABR1N045_9PEZI